MGTEWINAKQEMGVLGIIFDSCPEWSEQGDKSVLKARHSSQAFKRITYYFTDSEKKGFNHILSFFENVF